MNEQAGPLPILILATIFLVVWNMDPFIIEEGNATPIQEEYGERQSSTMGTKRETQQEDKKTYIAPSSIPFHSGNTNQVQGTQLISPQ